MQDIKLINDDCIIALKTLEDNSVDSIVTDPPAGISFMSKSWDSDQGGRDNWIKWMEEVAIECKRVLKPGGHAFVWAIPRTSHWTATAWENAGFEIRDVVAHVFGSGFPKSHNIGQSVDKLQGNEREVTGLNRAGKNALGQDSGWNSHENKTEFDITKGTSEYEGWGTALKPAREDWILMRKPLARVFLIELYEMYGFDYYITTSTAYKGTEKKPNKRYESYIEKGFEPVEENADEIRERITAQVEKKYQEAGDDMTNCEIEIEEKILKATPKPVFRFITKLATNPSVESSWTIETTKGIEVLKTEGYKKIWKNTVAVNALKHGTGGINIDESRVETKDTISESTYQDVRNNSYAGGQAVGRDRLEGRTYQQNPLGRFPANLIHDNSEEVRECFPETKSGGISKNYKQDSRFNVGESGKGGNLDESNCFNDSGNASRFFKSIKKELTECQKQSIMKVCKNNINVNNVENILKTTSQIELVANIFSALKNATPNLDLLNQNLNALFVGKSADSTEIDFVAKCVAIKEIPEVLVSQQEYTVFQDFMEDYKKCSQIQSLVSVEKWVNIDTTRIMTNLLKLCGYVLDVIDESTHLGNQDTVDQKCGYKSLIYQAKASKSERNKGCEDLPNQNNHVTIKPVALMEYLIKMVTPKGGTVLDPFMGSGSTGVASVQNGFDFIGIDMTPEYVEIAKARILCKNHQ